MALLVLGAFQREPHAAREIGWLAVVALAVTVALVMTPRPRARAISLYGMFVTDGFGALHERAGADRLGASPSSWRCASTSAKGWRGSNIPVLVLLATTGMMMMITANDLISLYVGLELQNLALYVIASFQRDQTRSSEAGLKYFVLGALSSGMLLYGASMVYGFAGSTNFDTLAHTLDAGERVHRADHRHRLRRRRPRLQGLGRALPHVDPRRL